MPFIFNDLFFLVRIFSHQLFFWAPWKKIPPRFLYLLLYNINGLYPIWQLRENTFLIKFVRSCKLSCENIQKIYTLWSPRKSNILKSANYILTNFLSMLNFGFTRIFFTFNSYIVHYSPLFNRIKHILYCDVVIDVYPRLIKYRNRSIYFFYSLTFWHFFLYFFRPRTE
jgi:hypothetical protein